MTSTFRTSTQIVTQIKNIIDKKAFKIDAIQQVFSAS